MKLSFHNSLLLGALLFCGGCVTGRELTYDHTVQVVKRPVNGMAELGWRVKTFWSEEMVSFWRRRISFPLLRHRDIPELSSEEQFMNPAVMDRWLRQKTGPPVQGTANLLFNGETFFSRLEESILTATNRIELKAYIFDNDDVAVEIAKRLKKRSHDITIRLLYDSGGSRASWGTDAPSLPPGYIYETDDMINYLSSGANIQLRRAGHTLLTSEHSKYIIIDDTAAYFGGMNIGREYRYDWRDAMFELTGPVIDALEIRFERAWILADGGPLTFFKLPKPTASEYPQDGDLYLIGTTPFKAHLYKAQLRAIKHARKVVYIENPYLWNPAVIYQLCAARKRGVDVRVTIPRDVNHDIGISANKLTVSRLREHGVRVFIYPGMTHVKAAVYDQWACFGSANFDDLSLHKNYELNIFTDNPQIVREIREDLLEEGQRRSVEIFDADDLSRMEIFIARFAQYL
ncbi:MAG: cardiolipin synthase [Verrucomicrobiota bacterium]|nr:cardiolipin synthase [Verrucomicrobiota bacterium]